MVIISSTSTMAIREVTGSHVLTIDGYSMAKQLQPGEFLTSSTFMAAGHRWCIRYYPCSSDYPYPDDPPSKWTSMYLQLERRSYSNSNYNGSSPCMARFTISLLDWNGQVVPWCSHVSKDGIDMAGFRKFVKRKDLDKSDHLRGDCFRVCCDITVLVKETTTPTVDGTATNDVATSVANAAAAVRSAVVPSATVANAVAAAVRSAIVPPPTVANAVKSTVVAAPLLPPPPAAENTVSKKEMTKEDDDDDAPARFVVVPPPDMDRHLGHLLSSGEGADVTLEVEGETFMAHRTIIVWSPVFKEELFGPMEEGTSPTCVRIKDMEASVFKVLLHFIYTDLLPPDVVDDDGESETMAMAQHLLVAAERYGMERLKLMCEDKLCNYVGTSSVGTILALAEQHGCDGLKKACLKFLMSGSNLKVAIATDGFDHLAKSCPSVLKELLSKVAL
ncbi:hypothetical protein HU200_007959 [Digitaria exilis]|uniref:BTB domain-containing protein n=1 Tax=Digitaria exilis TaxID=1010633 RepID=A0A835FLK1_9POAL|nr:hypothetical protein HU200_007959 [Digitaria exilis]